MPVERGDVVEVFHLSCRVSGDAITPGGAETSIAPHAHPDISGVRAHVDMRKQRSHCVITCLADRSLAQLRAQTHLIRYGREPSSYRGSVALEANWAALPRPWDLNENKPNIPFYAHAPLWRNSPREVAHPAPPPHTHTHKRNAKQCPTCTHTQSASDSDLPRCAPGMPTRRNGQP